MVLLFEWGNMEFWKGIKDGLESVMYLYQAFFIFINTLFTLAGLVISFYLFRLTHNTLVEIRNQRISSYLPDVIIEEENFVIKFMSNFLSDNSIGKKGFIFPRQIDYKNSGRLDSEKEYFELPTFQFFLKNIGIGSCKYVTVKFYYDQYNLYNIINKLDLKSMPNELKFKIYMRGNYLCFENRRYNFPEIYDLKNLDDNIKFESSILGMGEEGSKVLVSVPKLFWFYFLLYTYYLQYEENFQREMAPKYDDFVLKVSIEYFDIGKNKHEKDFDLIFRIVKFGRESSVPLPLSIGKFLVIETNTQLPKGILN